MNADSAQLKALVTKINDLPTLPVMMATIQKLMQSPKTSAEELGRAIATDPALVSKVLKLVNSAFYGFPGRIGTITQAIVILGFSTIRNLVLTTSVLKIFGKGQNRKGFDVESYWEHSLVTGALAKALAIEKGAHFQEETFIGGLLHDMGRMVLWQKAAAEFEKVVDYRDTQKVSLLKAEEAVLGLTHEEVGAWLARKWNLPVPYAEAMRLHHHPNDESIRNSRKQGEAGSLVAFVHVADVLSKGFKDGKIDPARLANLDPAVKAEMALDGATWESFCARSKEEVSKARAFLDLI